jgi:hypothetical protein
MLKARLVLFGFCSVIFSFLAGCSGVRMNVDTFNNPYLPITEYKRFSFLPSGIGDKTKEQHLFSVVKKDMEERGLVFDEKTPQFLIAVTVAEETKKNKNSNDDKLVAETTKKVSIIFIDNMHNKKETKLVWEGDASTTGLDVDLSNVDVEKCLIIGILQDYPNKLKSMSKNIYSFWCRK